MDLARTSRNIYIWSEWSQSGYTFHIIGRTKGKLHSLIGILIESAGDWLQLALCEKSFIKQAVFLMKYMGRLHSCMAQSSSRQVGNILNPYLMSAQTFNVFHQNQIKKQLVYDCTCEIARGADQVNKRQKSEHIWIWRPFQVWDLGVTWTEAWPFTSRWDQFLWAMFPVEELEWQRTFTSRKVQLPQSIGDL